MGEPSNSSDAAAVIVEGVLGGAGVLTCTLTIISAVVLKLHRQLVYRLAMYQVIAALVFGITSVLEPIQFMVMKYTGSSSVYLPLCLLDAFTTTFALLAKLFFTVIMTVHIFVYAVCFVNLKRLEVCYVMTSLVVPAVMAAVPFIHNAYGQQVPGQPWCWIVLESQNDTNGAIEAYVLSAGPALIGLAILLSLVVTMLNVLACRVCRNARGATLNKIAIKQMLPLMAYPVIYCVLMSISVFLYTYYAFYGTPSNGNAIILIDQVLNTGMVWVPSAAFLAHILVMVKSRKKIVQIDGGQTVEGDGSMKNTAEHERNIKSVTYFSFPTESVHVV